MMGSGRADDAARWLERTLLSSVRTLGEGSSLTVLRRNELALHYKGLGQGDKAEPLLRKQISIVERFAPPGDPLSLSVALNNLATLLYAGGRAVDAEPLLVRAVEVARGAGKKTVASWKNAIGAVRAGACAVSGEGAVGMFRLVAKNKGLAFDNLEQKKSEKDIAQGMREECLRELVNFKANLVAVRASLGHVANLKRGGGGGGGAGGGSGDESGGGGESRLRASSSASAASSVSVHTTDDSSDDEEGGGAAGKGGETKAELDGRMTTGTAGIAARMMAAARKRMAERNGEGSDGGDEKKEESKGLSHAASLAKLRGSPSSADRSESDIDAGPSADFTGEELTKWKAKVIKQVKTEQEDKREDRRRARKERAKARRKKKKEKQKSTTEADAFEASNDTKVDKWAGLRQPQNPAEAKLIREKYERLRKAFDLVDVRLHGARQSQPQLRPLCAPCTLS